MTEAAGAGELVVVSVPLRAYRAVPLEPTARKVVIDTNNYYPNRDGQIAELDDYSTTSSEMLQAHLPLAKVVKTFNNILWSTLRSPPRPSGAADRSALPIAGDDKAAKATVEQLLDRIGYDAVDAGPLAEGWRFQPDTPLPTDRSTAAPAASPTHSPPLRTRYVRSWRKRRARCPDRPTPERRPADTSGSGAVTVTRTRSSMSTSDPADPYLAAASGRGGAGDVVGTFAFGLASG